MFNRFKKFITFMLCASLLNACVLPSTVILAARTTTHKKQRVKPSVPHVKSSVFHLDEKKEESDKANPTMQESWHKVIKFEWNALNKADVWNIGKSVGGSIFTLAVAYALFCSKTACETVSHVGPVNDTPDNQFLAGIKIDSLIPIKSNIIGNLDKNKTTTTTKKEKKPKLLYPFAEQANRQNILVTRQEGNSCGYHSMLNAVLPLLNSNKYQAKHMVEQLFADADGIWRDFIIKARKKTWVQYYDWRNNLHYSDNLYVGEMRALKTFVLQQYGIKHDPITIIYNTNLLNTEAYQNMLIPAKKQMLNLNCMHSFIIRTSPNGDCDGQKIKQLTKTIAKANDTIKIITQEISTLKATLNSNRANVDQKKQAQETLQEKRTKLFEAELTKARAETERNTICEQIDTDTRGTHYITVTLERINGHNTYKIKDSMGDDYTDDVNVKQLIQALEK